MNAPPMSVCLAAFAEVAPAAFGFGAGMVLSGLVLPPVRERRRRRRFDLHVDQALAVAEQGRWTP